MQVQWYDSSDIQVISNESRIIVHTTTNRENGQVELVLLFDPVNRTDDGVYTCKAFNDPKCYAKANASLTVERKCDSMYSMVLSDIYKCRYLEAYLTKLKAQKYYN